ncbi:short chain oxidoreductase [Mytilinidion resinicola]|uniref:Short chain oxidoreductase n=1 Tax=Mytilinidion resinicola TaxID=574789 RepID=A0A6A6Y2Q8_9PEZI|nr:short chain oxidoreductase [Mytilinidion resinicola]KAF2803101.1 short chain oxidoreductase [Mytilinidion resinicola]
MPSYLITGCSRGLGLEMASQLSKTSGNLIFATARGAPTAALQKLIDGSAGRVIYVQLDAESPESIKSAVAQVEKHLNGKGLDILINNAGVMPFSMGGVATMDNLSSTFSTNVLSVHLVTSAFIPLLKKGTEKKVFNVSTTLGSIAHAATYRQTPAPAYAVTKAALNMLTVQYSLGYEDQGFTFIALSPGWLKTDLGGEGADLPVADGAEATLKIVHEKGKEDTGKFFNIKKAGWGNATGLNYYDGKEVSW